MIQKTPSPQPDHVRVTFELPSCIWADRIFLSGDFNDWSESATPLRQARDGTWRVSVDLPAGTQAEFRYIIDGQWQTDSQADGFAPNTHGSDNSIVIASLPSPASDGKRLGTTLAEMRPAPTAPAMLDAKRAAAKTAERVLPDRLPESSAA